MANTVYELLRAGKDGDPAIVVPGGPTLTFAELRRQIDHLAGQLNKVGVGRGDRVALVTPNGPEAAISFLAVAVCATAAPLNPAYREEEFRFYMDDLRAKALITLPGDAEAAHAAAGADVLRLALDGAPGNYTLTMRGVELATQAPRYAEPDDIALVLHTSGTTARPKIVPLSQRNLATSVGNIMTSLALTPSDRCLNVMPLFHIHGLMAALLASLGAGRFDRDVAGLRRVPVLRLAGRDEADLVHGGADDASARAEPGGASEGDPGGHASAFRAFVLGIAAADGYGGAGGDVRGAGDRGVRHDGGVAPDGDEPAAAGRAQARVGRVVAPASRSGS